MINIIDYESVMKCPNCGPATKRERQMVLVKDVIVVQIANPFPNRGRMTVAFSVHIVQSSPHRSIKTNQTVIDYRSLSHTMDIGTYPVISV